jgi:hypothetical protein
MRRELLHPRRINGRLAAFVDAFTLALATMRALRLVVHPANAMPVMLPPNADLRMDLAAEGEAPHVFRVSYDGATRLSFANSI